MSPLKLGQDLVQFLTLVEDCEENEETEELFDCYFPVRKSHLKNNDFDNQL